MSSQRIPARAAHTRTSELAGEFVVLNLDTSEAHALEGPAAAVWAAAGGTADVDPIALAQLEAAGLLESSGVTRRTMLARSGLVAAGVGIASIALPMAEAAASLTTGPLVVTLTPPSGPDGKVVQVTVTNLPTVTGAAISTVSVAGIFVTPSNTTVTSGTANFTITIPNNLTVGGKSVVVNDNHNNTGSATYTVVAPTVTITPVSQPKHTGKGDGSGTFHVATSGGFAPNSTLTVTFPPNPQGSGAILTLTGGPASTGATGQIPTSPNFSFTNTNGTGSNTITFKDASGNTATATFSFT